MFFVKKSNSLLFVFLGQPREKRTFFVLQIEKNSFKSRKVKFQKTLKSRNVSKGLVHVFLSKNRPFCYLCFLDKLSQ